MKRRGRRHRSTNCCATDTVQSPYACYPCETAWRESMSWGEVFFGFRGRINRKTFWFASILVNIAGLLFIALLAYLATGNPISPDVWRTPPDKAGVWAPVWLPSFAFLAWPLSALAAKRLQDRGRPAWLWYAYYGLTVVFSLPPLKNAAGPELNPA